MKIRVLIAIVILCVFSYSCGRINASDSALTDSTSDVDDSSDQRFRKVLDTIIIAEDINKAESGHESTAKAALIQYFKNKGALTRTELIDSPIQFKQTLFIEYDTLFDIKTERFMGSIVCYWLGPYDLNGNCYRARKALVIFKDDYYKVYSEEIIQTSWEIDSVKNGRIYGYEYECGGRGVLKNVIVSLR